MLVFELGLGPAMVRIRVRVRAQSLARGALGHCLDKLDMCKVLVGGGALRNVRLDLVGL